jgi:hypothetical protein
MKINDDAREFKPCQAHTEILRMAARSLGLGHLVSTTMEELEQIGTGNEIVLRALTMAATRCTNEETPGEPLCCPLCAGIKEACRNGASLEEATGEWTIGLMCALAEKYHAGDLVPLGEMFETTTTNGKRAVGLMPVTKRTLQ